MSRHGDDSRSIVISQGEPSGVGPEIAVKAWAALGCTINGRSLSAWSRNARMLFLESRGVFGLGIEGAPKRYLEFAGAIPRYRRQRLQRQNRDSPRPKMLASRSSTPSRTRAGTLPRRRGRGAGHRAHPKVGAHSDRWVRASPAIPNISAHLTGSRTRGDDAGLHRAGSGSCGSSLSPSISPCS